MTFEAPRETVELLPFEITLDGEPQTSGVEYAIVRHGSARPADWTAAEVVNGKTHARLEGMAAGYYKLYARVDAGNERPVVDCGLFQVD